MNQQLLKYVSDKLSFKHETALSLFLKQGLNKYLFLPAMIRYKVQNISITLPISGVQIKEHL